MKVINLVLLFCLFVSFHAAVASSPSDIDLKYNPENRVLTAVITHPVTNSSNHYIAQIDVAVNGKTVIQHKIKLQDNNESQTVSYSLPDVGPRDRIEVEATCNIGGVAKKLLEIE